MLASRSAAAVAHLLRYRVEFGPGRAAPFRPDPEPVADGTRDHVQVDVEDLLERGLTVGGVAEKP
jgi:hypothetical protein